MTQTDADFDQLSWHDCHIWGIELVVGDPDLEDWTSDLALDLDFITEWIRAGETYEFRVAPARLVFHGVTDSRIEIDWGTSGFQTALHGVSIAGIERERVQNQKVYLDRPYYKWRIELNWPKGGEITLGAVGFTQTVFGDPVVIDKQYLSRSERRRLMAQ